MAKNKQVRSKLIEAWNLCEFNVKERVKRDFSHRMIHYIMTTETYTKTDVMLSIINSIKKHSTEVKNEALKMDKNISNIEVNFKQKKIIR